MPHSPGVGSDFRGSTAIHYASFRRDVPDALMNKIVSRLHLTVGDRALDLGCGSGQVAVPLAARVGVVVALDPEVDMLVELRSRLRTEGVDNVLPVFGADSDLGSVTALLPRCFAAITVANALHWMDAGRVFSLSRELLRTGGALVVISQGPPMWLSAHPWARAVRGYLEDWMESPVDATCGTDEATLGRRRELLEQNGFEPVELIEHSYEHDIDPDWVVGHLYSAMPESAVPLVRRPDFESGLRHVLAPQVAAGPLVERIDATALVAVQPERSFSGRG